MFLKSLSLKGFKSFADTTLLDFEPGVTVVVGPNGSGKSNVVDAVAWVLGAQGPTTVRSQKMDDVIFAGTTKRPALGRAEVALTLDNSSGVLPVDFTEVTISRTLYRSGDSEYALNGVPCRLLDIQDMLSDAGVGRHQHVIVAQGQIDHVLNARPEERRLIIEEAAGILKFRRRKERAERRLAATEANLLRLQDLQREVRRQLKPLERQAEAARRHGELSGELHALKLHRAGTELTALKQRLAAIAAQRRDAADTQRAARAELGRVDVAITAAEARLAAAGDDIGDRLVRVESLRERARGLAAVLAERRRSTERDRGALLAEDVVASLEADAAQLRDALTAIDTEAAELEPEQQRVAAAEAELSRLATDAAPAAPGEELPDIAARADRVRGEVAVLRSAAERAASDLDRLAGRQSELAATTDESATSAGALRARLAEAEQRELELLAAVDAAEAAHTAADDAGEAARRAARDAAADQRTAAARVEALRLALDDARARAGLDRLADVDGIVGTLLDLVEIDDGWEHAVEAGAGDAISAVVTSDTDTARRVLARLHADDGRGAVLALGGPAPPAPHRPPAGEPVRDRVRCHDPDVSVLLDRVLARVVAVDGAWHDAVDLALAHPDVVVVTLAGDRFGPSCWRIGAGGAGATAAAFDEAIDTLRLADDTAAAAEAMQRRTVAEIDVAHTRLAERTAALEAHDSVRAALADELALVEGRARDAATEAGPLDQRVGELVAQLDRDRARLTELEELLPVLEADEAEGRRAAVELDQRSRTLAALRADIGAREAGLAQRRQLVEGRLADLERRLADDRVDRERAAGRRARLDAVVHALDSLTAVVGRRVGELDRALDGLRAKRLRRSEVARAASAELDHLRRSRTELDGALDKARDDSGRLDVDEAESKLRLETALATVRGELGAEPDEAETAPCPPLPDGASAAGHLRELERELRRLGPINPLALDEYEELSERHDFVAEQLDDVRSTRRDLQKVIRAVDHEIVRVFSAAFADVATNFEQLFVTLFPGGTGRLRLTEPGNLLDTGVELDARPSGKNIKKLSLLSGGERSLTALAYLFAIFRSRPAPFYVMDEVEAALDDVNLNRFLSLVEEFRREAQLLVVSHQKRTMEAGDCLYGVSMQPGGSSKVVSERATGTGALGAA